jgi:hypothetical protein
MNLSKKSRKGLTRSPGEDQKTNSQITQDFDKSEGNPSSIGKAAETAVDHVVHIPDSEIERRSLTADQLRALDSRLEEEIIRLQQERAVLHVIVEKLS